MAWWNFKNWQRIGFKDETNHNVIGFEKKYRISQDVKEWAFEEAYARTTDVYSITNKIVDNAKTVPWILKLKRGDDIENVTQGELYDLIQYPNPEQSRVEYTESGLKQLLIGGNMFYKSLVPFGMTKPTQTMFLHPQNIEIKTMLEGMVMRPKGYIYRIDGKEFKIEPEKITHVKYCNPTDYGIESLEGLSPVVAGALTVMGLNNNQTASASILEHQGAAGILSNESEYPSTAEEQEKQQENFDRKMAGATLFGKIIQAASKVKYTKLGLDPTQLKIIESKVLKMRDLCNIYDVDSVLFNDKAASTFNNIKEAKKSLWTGPVTAANQMIINGFDKEVVQKFNISEFPNGEAKYYIEADYSDVEALQEDDLKNANKGKAISEIIIKILTAEITTDEKVAALMKSLNMSREEAESHVSIVDN